RVEALQEEVKKLQQQLKKGAATDLQGAGDRLLAGAAEVNGVKVLVGEMPAGAGEQMRNQVGRLGQKAGRAVLIIGWAEEGQGAPLAGVTRAVEKRVSAGNLVKEAAAVVGGKGGGRPDMAQAGGKDPAKLGEALARARTMALEALAK